MNIEQIIQKFYEGASTPEEERFLTEYFLNEENVDEQWEDDRQLFQLLHDTQIQVPEGVSKRLAESIRQNVKNTTRHPELDSGSPCFQGIADQARNDVNGTARHPELDSGSPEHEGIAGQARNDVNSIPRRRTFYYWISSAAAVALLCIGLFFATREPSSSKMADTFSNPEDAALVAGQTLAFISAQLNNGLDKVADVEHEFEKVNNVLNKHLK